MSPNTSRSNPSAGPSWTTAIQVTSTRGSHIAIRSSTLEAVGAVTTVGEHVIRSNAQTPLVDPFTNQPQVNPATGELLVEHQLLATSQNNFIYVGGVPIFYWPVIATDLTEPTYYLTGARFKNDRVFGTGVLLDWDLYQLLGIANKPPGSKWTLSTDYLSLRGPARKPSSISGSS